MDLRFWVSATTDCTVAHWNNDVAHEPWSKLYLLTSGTARYAVARPGEQPAWTTLRPGRLYLIPGGRRQINACSAGFRLHWCHFTAHDSDLSLRLNALDAVIERPTATPDGHGEIIAQACHGVSARLRASALALDLIAQLPQPQDDIHAAERTRLASALHELEYRFTTPLSVARLARMAGLKPSRFHALFRQVHGTSVRAYQLELRFAEAQRLLRDGRLGVAEVAARCGYSSPFTFSRMFSARIGISPSQFQAAR